MYLVHQQNEFNSSGLFNNFNFSDVLYSNIFYSLPAQPQTIIII